MTLKSIVFSSAAIIFFCLSIWSRPQLTREAGLLPPETVFNRNAETGGTEKPCPQQDHPEWRQAQVIEGVQIDEALTCEPDNPFDVAVAVKGTANVSMATLMKTHLAQDALTLSDDLDHDGDPDIIRLKLEVVELNGSTPDGQFLINTFDIAPGIQPGMWVYAPKSRGMALKNFNSIQANPLLRAPSPAIRVEQGDQVFITLENTHYLPHTIHLHGVDHPWLTAAGADNDGVEEHAVFPGQIHTYEIKPRHSGTMLYHCHVQTAQHYLMGLNGLFIVEENRPNNWVQTFNIGGGQVRHPSAAVRETYQHEYDLYYQSLDKQLSSIIQNSNDPRLISKRMSREYNMTESEENYFLLNGHSFPYTIRDGLITVSGNEHVKLRVANAQRSPVAIHFHGHKPTVTANDGVDLPEIMQTQRDVIDIAPAQRVDLKLTTANNGLDSYGPGLWMFHDHVLTGTTTDGMEPGGNMAILAYKALLDEQGMPEGHAEMFDQTFDKNYYAKNQALWNQGVFADLLGDPGPIRPDWFRLIVFGLSAGATLVFTILFIVSVSRKRAQ